MPSDSGVTSSSSMSRLPVIRMSACTAAPSATTSSGFSSLCGVRPNSSSTLPAHERNARRAADQDDLVDLRRLEAGVGQRLPARRQRALDDRRDQRLELGAGEASCRSASVSSRSREIDLGLDGGLADLLDRPPRSGCRTPDAEPDDRRTRTSSSVRRARGRSAGCRCRRRRGACRRWWRAPGRRRPRRAGSRCRTCRRRGRRPR